MPKNARGRSKAAKPVATKHLTLDLIYGQPSLGGRDISQVQWQPGGRLLTFNLGDGPKNEIRGYNPADKSTRLIFDYARIVPPGAKGQRQWFWDADDEHLPWRMRVLNVANVLTFSYTWSPNGKQMLVAASETGPYYLLDVATGSLSATIPLPAGAQDINFSPDSQWLSFVLGYNLYLLGLGTGQVLPVTAGGTEAFRYATPDTFGDFLEEGYWWAPDSSRVACLVSDENAVLPFPLQMLTSLQGSIQSERFPQPGQSVPQMGLLIAGSGGTVWIDAGRWAEYYLARVQWLPDSRRLALQLMNRRQNHLILAIGDATTGFCQTVLEEQDPCWINLTDDLTFLNGGARFVWSHERESHRHLHLYSIDGTHLVQLTSGGTASIKVKGVDENNRAVYFKTFPEPYSDGHVQRVRYNVGQDGKYTALPAEILTSQPGVHSVQISPDYRYFADLHSSAVMPPHLDLYSTSTGLLGTVEANNVPDLAQYLAPVEFLPPIPAAKMDHPSDCFGLYGRMIKPRNLESGKKHPAIVYVYGGPVPGGTGRTVVNKWFHVPDLWLQFMAQKGYVVYSLDNRGSCEAPRGHAFETAIHQRLGKVELADQLEGVKYLKSLPFVDPDRIGIFGGSFGGFMALNAMLRAPGVFKAGVSFAPVTDWQGFDSIYTEQYMDLPAINLQGYADTRIPPLAANLEGKLMLLHGTADLNVHLPHTFQLMNQLQSAGKYFDIMLYPAQGHGLFFEVAPVALLLFEKITHFFDEHL